MPMEQLSECLTHIHPYVTAVHLREKDKTARELYQAVNLLTKNNLPLSKIILNDRVDVALATGARGVQLAFHSLPVSITKSRFPELTLGCSIHSVEEGKNAQENGADYVLYGHVFPSKSKPGLAPRGLEELKNLAALDIPVVAIGGITPENTSHVIRAGAKGIAVISGIFEANDPIAAAKAYHHALQEDF